MDFPSADLCVLKTLLTNKKYALDFANEHDAKLFSTDVWNFSNLVVSYIKTYKEIPTLRVITEKLAKGNNEKLVETVKKTWEQIEKIQYDDKEYKHDLEKLKKRFAEKEITDIKTKLSKFEPGSMDVSKAILDMQKAVQTIKGLNATKAYERKTLKDAVPIFREQYNAKMEDATFDQGIKTGYSYFDYVTDGLRPGEMVLIGGESGAGKSMLLMNMAIQIWLQKNTIDTEEANFTPGNGVLYFSLEMPFKPCLNRVLARLSSNPSKLIRSAKLNQDEAVKLKKALKFITKYPDQFEIVDIPRGATIENLESIYEEAKVSYDPKVIVIDYLGLMDDDSNEDDWLKLGKIAGKVHEFARAHNVTVLSAVQLNRSKGGKDAEEKIGMHRIGRSALIMTHANIAVQIESRPNEKQYPDMMYHLIKNRDGELGKGQLIKNLACGTLIDESLGEDDTVFEMRDPDDISEKLELLDL
jgi:replicative DNA helicase